MYKVSKNGTKTRVSYQYSVGQHVDVTAINVDRSDGYAQSKKLNVTYDHANNSVRAGTVMGKHDVA